MFRALFRFAALVALVAVATTQASPIEEDPFTTTDGRVIVPTSPEDRAAADADIKDNGIYTTLSDNGPMAGGPIGHGRRLRDI